MAAKKTKRCEFVVRDARVAQARLPRIPVSDRGFYTAKALALRVARKQGIAYVTLSCLLPKQGYPDEIVLMSCDAKRCVSEYTGMSDGRWLSRRVLAGLKRKKR